MLEFKNVSFSGAEKVIVEDLSLKLEDGENLSITGQSSTDKTSLLLAMQGFLPFEKGYYTIEGERMNKDSAAYFRQRMCYLPQYLELPYEKVTDWINVVLGLKVNRHHEISKKMIALELQKLGLEETVCNEPPENLDKTTLQLVMLAMEGLLKKPFVFLDDLQVGLQVEYLRQLNHVGVSVIAVLGDESLINLFDKHILLDKERI